MYLLLIRHGESVDNVAGVYAGSRDSPLTNHGVLQTQRLGAHLASRRNVIGPVTHIFTSNLQRAYRTAEAIADAQRGMTVSLGRPDVELNIMQLPELREKDFGSGEGVKYKALATGRADGSIASDSETRDAMMIRVNRFITDDLVSVFNANKSQKITVAIVAHGIILGTLLQALTARFPARALSAPCPDGGRTGAVWSNTGVLQAKIESIAFLRFPHDDRENANGALSNTTFTVQHTNNTDHLNGLKKTRGGIGSAKFDERQRLLTAFFVPTSKKRKAEEVAQ